LTNSSLNLPIAANSSVLGMIPASVSLLAFTITMNRIVSLRLSIGQAGRLARPTIAHQQDEPPFTAPTCPEKLFWR
jgi:hypothetical protein